MTFQGDLEALLNTYSMENTSNTPDYVLASYLCGCLDEFNAAVLARRRHYQSEELQPASTNKLQAEIARFKQILDDYKQSGNEVNIDYLLENYAVIAQLSAV